MRHCNSSAVAGARPDRVPRDRGGLLVSDVAQRLTALTAWLMPCSSVLGVALFRSFGLCYARRPAMPTGPESPRKRAAARHRTTRYLVPGGVASAVLGFSLLLSWWVQPVSSPQLHSTTSTGSVATVDRCSSSTALEAIHAAIFLMEHDTANEVIDAYLHAAADDLVATGCGDCWTRGLASRTRAALQMRERGNSAWRTKTEELRLELHESACLEPSHHARMHDRLSSSSSFGPAPSAPGKLKQQGAGQ